GLTAVTLGLAYRAAEAAMPPPGRANLELVTAFFNSFAGGHMPKIASCVADTGVYRVTETAPRLQGRDAVERIRSYVAAAETIEFKILESWVKGPVVVNERVDSFVSPQRKN